MADNGPVEPDATSRKFAKTLRQLFLALTLEGFTETQALVVIGQIVAATTPKPPNG